MTPAKIITGHDPLTWVWAYIVCYCTSGKKSTKRIYIKNSENVELESVRDTDLYKAQQKALDLRKTRR